MSAERTQKLDEVTRLCTDIEHHVEAGNWDIAGQLLSRRHQLLEEAFAEPVATQADVEELQIIAEQVMEFDSALMPLADAARGEAAEDLKKLRRGRNAAAAYKQTSG